jgi:RimJ/RimL family protein N-acetyltransferase
MEHTFNRAAVPPVPSASAVSLVPAVEAPAALAPHAAAGWRQTVPVLAGGGVTLREVDLADAPSLFSLLTAEEVARFISPPPPTIEGFERFVRWAHQERAAGRYICFAVVPEGAPSAVGIFQLRAMDPGFTTAEWGFALGSGFWGTGVFVAGATVLLDFAADVIGVHRFEARAAVVNGRGNGALRKIGAVCEGVLRRAFERNGRHHDQMLWSILAEEWRWQRGSGEVRIH